MIILSSSLLSAGIGTIIWTGIAFLVVLFILWKMAWGPILESMKEREDFIEDSIQSAKKATEQMSQLKSDNKKLLAEARLEQEKIVKSANDAKTKIISEAKDAATLESDRLIAKAKEEIQREKSQAMSDIKTQVAALSVEIAEKLIKSELSDKERQLEFVEKQLKQAQLN